MPFQEELRRLEQLAAAFEGTIDVNIVEGAAQPLSTTGTTSSIPASITSVVLASANLGRTGLSIENDSTSDLYILLSDGDATTNNYTVRMVGDSYFELPFRYSGVIKGIWDTATGNARVTEFE